MTQLSYAAAGVDIDAGDVVGSELLGRGGSLAGQLEAELAQLAEIHLVARLQGLDHVLDGADQDRRDIRPADGRLAGNPFRQSFQG